MLIDEFGKGTHYLDGLSLFDGVWKSFQKSHTEMKNLGIPNINLSQKLSSPLLIMACSRSELFNQEIIKPLEIHNGK